MKTRNGFVSNSSSSSFILDKRYLTPLQCAEIIDYAEDKSDCWSISEDEDFIKGFTIMDNNILYDYIKEEINPQLKAIVSWGE